MTRSREEFTPGTPAHDAEVVVGNLFRSGMSLKEIDDQVRHDHETFVQSLERRGPAERVWHDEFMTGVGQSLGDRGYVSVEQPRTEPGEPVPGRRGVANPWDKIPSAQEVPASGGDVG